MSSSDASTETTSATSASSTAPAPASLPGPRGAGPYRVIMVCTGNICRSAMAEVVLRDRLAAAGIPDSGPGGVTVTSAGVSDEERGNPIDSRARRVLTAAGYGTGADDVSCATGSALASHTAHRVTDAEIAEADLLLAMTDSHWNVLRRRAAGLGVEPARIRMYRELDPASTQQAEAVAAGGSSRGVLNVPDPWYGTMADFVDTLEVIERVSDELADELAALLDQLSAGGCPASA